MKRTQKKDSGLNRHLATYKAGAKSRGLDFLLSKEQFTQLSSNPCHYCGINPEPRKFSTSPHTFYFNGIDRKNNKMGYTIENCVSCCKMCNFQKGKYDYDEFKAWIKRLIVYNKQYE